MSFSRSKSDYKRYLTNSLGITQYIKIKNVRKLVSELNGGMQSSNPKEDLRDMINAGNDKAIKALEDYEYDMYYKYFAVYKIDNDDITKKITDFLSTDAVNKGEYDYISDGFEKPTVRGHLDGVDFKFSLILSERPDYSTGFKYPVLITILPDEKLLLIKYSGLILDSAHQRATTYNYTHDRAKVWITRNLGITMTEFDGISAFRDLRSEIRHSPEIHEDEKNIRVRMNDEFNGSTAYTSTDDDEMYFVDGVLAIASEIKDDVVRNKLVSFVESYEFNSDMIEVGIKWKAKFVNSRGKKGHISVVARKTYEETTGAMRLYKFTRYHVLSHDSVNRERINYVVRYLSAYPKPNTEEGIDTERNAS